MERPLRTRTKHTSEVLQNYDIVACRRPDGLYELRQLVDQELVMIRVRTFERLEVEAAAVDLARREHSDAWIQDGMGSYRPLDVWMASGSRPMARPGNRPR